MDPGLTALIFEWAVSLGLTAVIVGLLTIYMKVKDLHQWHNKEDEEGVKVWYTRNKDMEETLDKMAEILDRLDRREERSLLIQNHQIEVLEKHTVAVTGLVAVVEALTKVVTK
jgi:hypothetical protein